MWRVFIIVDQAVKLGIAEANFSSNHLKWLAINNYVTKVCIGTNIEQFMPVKLAQALVSSLFPKKDSQL